MGLGLAVDAGDGEGTAASEMMNVKTPTGIKLREYFRTRFNRLRACNIDKPPPIFCVDRPRRHFVNRSELMVHVPDLPPYDTKAASRVFRRRTSHFRARDLEKVSKATECFTNPLIQWLLK